MLLLFLMFSQSRIVFSANDALIEGTVIDSSTDLPLQMASIHVDEFDQRVGKNIGSATTDRNGFFSLRVPIKPRYHIVVDSKQLRRDQYVFYDHCGARRIVQYAPIIRLTFALEPAGSILIKMYDVDGRSSCLY